MKDNRSLLKSRVYTFRVTQEQKVELDKLLKTAKSRLNKGKTDDERTISTSDIILRILTEALPTLKKW